MGGMAGRESPPRILIADDQPDVLVALELLLKSAGCKTVSCTSPAAILETARALRPDAILLDLNYTRDTTSGQEGLSLLTELRQIDHTVPVVVMTAWGTMELAVEAMRRGALDFVLKPWDNTTLVRTLKTKIEERHFRDLSERRFQEDMAIARRVQNNLFPRHLPRVPGLDYAGACVQAGAVGGDYYDFLELAGGQLAAVIADVSGKGVPAALLMANLQATLRGQCLESARLSAPLMGRIHRLYLESTEPHNYATLFVGAFDTGARLLRYVNCGHCPPILLRAGGEFERLEPTAMVLGLLPGWECDERCVPFGPGDLLALYSDGVTEAGRDREDEFGEGRLVEVLSRGRSTPVPELIGLVVDEVRRWGGPVPEDDLTLVILRGL